MSSLASATEPRLTSRIAELVAAGFTDAQSTSKIASVAPLVTLTIRSGSIGRR